MISLLFIFLTYSPCLGYQSLLHNINVEHAKNTIVQNYSNDGIEGIWLVNQTWAPNSSQIRTYNILITKNIYNIKHEWQFLGIMLDKKAGMSCGDLKFVMSQTETKGTYKAIGYFESGLGMALASGVLVLRGDIMDSGLALGGNRPISFFTRVKK